MTNNAKKILKGSTLRVALLISSIIIGLFMMPFLIGNLGDEKYGMWVLVSAVVSFYSLMDFGMAEAIQRFLIRSVHSNDSEDTKIALSTSFFLSAGVGLVTLCITFGIIFFASSFVTEEADILLFQITIALVGLKSSIQLPLFSYYGILVANYRYDLITIIQFFTMITRTVLIVLFINAGYGIIAIAGIALVTDITGSLIVIRNAKNLIPGITASFSYFSTSKVKEYFHFAKWNYIIQITHKIRFSIDELVVGFVIGISAVTHYTIASTLISYFSSFMESAFGVFQPVFHKYHKLDQWDNLRSTFLITTEITSFASVLVGCILYSLGEIFISIWIGDSYSDSFMVLLILCTSNIFYKSILPCEKIIFAIAKQKYYAKISSMEAITNMVLSLTLASYLGIYGVALGTLIPSLISNLYLLPMYTCRQLTLPNISFYRILFKACLLGLITFLPMNYMVKMYGPENLFIVALYAGLFSITYMLICFKFVISNEATNLILDSLPDKFLPYIRPFTRGSKGV